MVQLDAVSVAISQRNYRGYLVLDKEVYKPGMVFDTLFNGQLVILEYYSWDRVLVQFKNTGYKTEARTWCIKNGNVRDHLRPSVYGVGFIGDGPYAVRINKKISPIYKLWQSMLGRCYSPVFECYKNVTVDVNWHNFQNFAKWYDNYAYTKVGWQLDKDIFSKEGKHYSEETCTFVPQEINSCLAEKAQRDLPYGVDLRFGRYRTGVSEGGKRRLLGTFDTMEEAHEAYKNAKKSVIVGLAEKHKFGLHPKTYEALLEWKV